MKTFRFLFALIALPLFFAACSSDETAQPQTEQKPDDQNALFTVQVTDISAVMATVSVEPKQESQTYYWDVLSDADFKQAEDKGIDDYLQWMLNKRLMEELGLNFPDAIKAMTSQGKDSSTVTGLVPGSTYHAIAVGIDGEGFSTTEVVAVEFRTTDPIVSQNTFSVTIDEHSHNGARITVDTSNDDPYFLDVAPVDTEAEEQLTDRELAENLLNRYLTWGGVADLCHSGDYSYTDTERKPGWEYRVVVFGYDKGMITTDVHTYPLVTLPGGDPAVCTFKFDHTFSSYTYSKFSYTPSDNNVVYMADVIEEDYYQQYVDLAGGNEQKAMEDLLKQFIDTYSADFSTRMETVDMISSVGELTLDVYAKPETEYRMWAVCIDQQGRPVAPFVSSEVFRTPELQVSTAALELKEYTWYNGDELYKADPGRFANARGYAVLSVKVAPSANAAHWYLYAYLGDLTESSDRSVINNLVAAGEQAMDQTEMLIICYWGETTICGVAVDDNNGFGPILRQVVDLTEEGASPVPDSFKKH